TFWSTISFTLSRRASFDSPLSARMASTLSEVLCTTSRGDSWAAARTATPVRRNAKAIESRARQRSRDGVDILDFIDWNRLGNSPLSSILDQCLAALEVSIAHEDVVVQRRDLRVGHLLQELCPRVHDVDDTGAEKDPAVDEERHDGSDCVDTERGGVA